MADWPETFLLLLETELIKTWDRGLLKWCIRGNGASSLRRWRGKKLQQLGLITGEACDSVRDSADIPIISKHTHKASPGYSRRTGRRLFLLEWSIFLCQVAVDSGLFKGLLSYKRPAI